MVIVYTKTGHCWGHPKVTCSDMLGGDLQSLAQGSQLFFPFLLYRRQIEFVPPHHKFTEKDFFFEENNDVFVLTAYAS